MDLSCLGRTIYARQFLGAGAKAGLHPVSSARSISVSWNIRGAECEMTATALNTHPAFSHLASEATAAGKGRCRTAFAHVTTKGDKLVAKSQNTGHA